MLYHLAFLVELQKSPIQIPHLLVVLLGRPSKLISAACPYFFLKNCIFFNNLLLQFSISCPLGFVKDFIVSFVILLSLVFNKSATMLIEERDGDGKSETSLLPGFLQDELIFL